MSPFLSVPPSDHVASNPLAFAIRDPLPVAPGHTLIVPRRVVPSWFDATRDEQLAILDLLAEVERRLDAELRPDGYHVSFDAGPVPHLHVHVVPRFEDALPGPLSTGGEADPFARHCLPLLARAEEVAIVAAVQETGLTRIQPALESALRAGASVQLLTGDYLHLTQASALETLLDWQSTWTEPEDDDEPAGRPAGTLETRVIEVDRLPGRTRTFHPKSWWLRGPRFGVAFVGGWWVEPVQGEVVALAPLRGMIAYPDLRAAAGHAAVEQEDVEREQVLLPLDPAPELFAVRVAGTSMDGGRAPLRDGDWAVFRLARGAPASAVVDRVVLVQVPGRTGFAWQIKRVVRAGERWRLVSDNPDGPSFDATEDLVVVARLERAVRPEDLAPPVGTLIPEGELGARFGLDELLPRTGRYGGHGIRVRRRAGGARLARRGPDGRRAASRRDAVRAGAGRGWAPVPRGGAVARGPGRLADPGGRLRDVGRVGDRGEAVARAAPRRVGAGRAGRGSAAGVARGAAGAGAWRWRSRPDPRSGGAGWAAGRGRAGEGGAHGVARGPGLGGGRAR
jgi:diadenosine tetraphosphate (Ap4A) HIT family hydrolase/SOS-response transcriptional repressor LexA